MEMQTSPIEDCTINKDNCCSDVIIQFEGQSELKIDFTNLNYEQQLFVTSFTYTYVNLFEGLDKNIVPFKNYTPPLLVWDIQVLDEVYLI